jgi:hypothetical protein
LKRSRLALLEIQDFVVLQPLLEDSLVGSIGRY